jgi:hypothetical protein
MPFVYVGFLRGNLMFPGGKKEAALAAKVAAIGDIVNGTSDVEPGYPLVSLVPVFVEQRTDCFHNYANSFEVG